MDELLKERILKILNEHRQDMEGYSYYGSNYGVSEDDFEEIADKIILATKTELDDPKDPWCDDCKAYTHTTCPESDYYKSLPSKVK